MQRILACTDGSLYSTSIYEHTAWAANRSGAAVHVLHSLDPHREVAQIADLSGNLVPGSSDELLAELVNFEETKNRLARERGKLILNEARRQLHELGISEVTTEQQHGSLVETVTELEETSQLVVMGKRGESADMASNHLGSNLERVIRASIQPVLVATEVFKPINRFLIAYDGGPSAEKSIQYAISHPLLKNLTCHIVRAGHIDANAEWFLKETEAKLQAAGFQASSQSISGDATKVITSTIKTEGVDLLVMGAYGHSRIRSLVLGSTTTEMIRTTSVPVLMFR